MYDIKIGCPWGKAPCGRSEEIVKEIGCAGCPAFNQKKFEEIMNSAAEEEERRKELLDENLFGPWENQW